MLLGIFLFFVLCFMIHLEEKSAKKNGRKPPKYKDETEKYYIFDDFIDKK